MPYRCLNCNFTTESTDYRCDAPGCGFKVGRFEYEHDTSSSSPSSPTQDAWESLITGPFLVCLFGLLAYGAVRLGVPIVLGILGFVTSTEVNWNTVDRIVPTAAVLAAVGAMAWLVHLELGGVSGIRTYMKEAPEKGILLLKALGKLLIAAALLYGAYQLLKAIFFK